ncbi:hypothetical protein niasHT_020803 [Heterodera trifolii]|uniref:Uncharacterized protein n=1 Tax=Heterodera trifolii TaxID=157864 RepID=A0ABD2KG95_9BILA
MHDIHRQPNEQSQKEAFPHLKTKKEVLNLLWTSVALAREKLAVGKANGKVAKCLLKFLARTVGGAFAPFAQSEKHSKHFLRELRSHQLAFLSSGYHRFWRSRGGIKHFHEAQKNVQPIFMN